MTVTGELLDAVPMAVVVVDHARRISGWNRAAETLYGYPTAVAAGAPFIELLFDADDRDAASALLDAAGEGRPWEGDFRVCRSDGALLVSSFRLAPAGAVSGFAWLATDGIDQGLAEQERSVLLSAERAARSTAEEALGLVEAILASAPVGIAVFDLDLRYVRVNDAYAALSGVPAADHVGGQLGDVLALQAEVGADLRRVVTTGRTILGRNVDLITDSEAGEQRSFTVSYFPVRTTAGALVGAGVTLFEVTEARRAEAERAALLKTAEAAHQRLSILATASTVLTTTMELEELLARLTRVLTPIAADWCVIELVGRDGRSEHVAVSHRSRAAAQKMLTTLRAQPVAVDGEGPVSEVLRSGQARLVGPEGVPRLAALHPVGSGVVVPIESRGRVLGVLILASEGDRTLSDDDLDLAVEIAHRAALAVGNARAFQQEHEIAENLQRALLPTSVPKVDGLELAVRYVAATDGASVGGDWYDVLVFDDGTTGIVVGDVVGHDIAASTSMGQLRSAIRIYAWEEHARPAAALARVDRLFDKLGLDYATCIFGVLDLEDSTFRWSNAGHPPPLLLRDGEATFLTESTGVLLGVTAGECMTEATTGLRDGDFLVLYTDGLLERRGESLQAGLDRLAAAAARSGANDADVLCEHLLEALVPATATRDDDVAILVARVGTHWPALGIHRLNYEPVPSSAALTRGFTAGVLEGAGWRDRVDTAVLLVSELVTNSVRHARGPCALQVSFDGDTVEFCVEDGDPTMPVARIAQGLDESGRGFLLVGALADRWGVRITPGGKATWFTLSRSSPEE